MHARPLNPAAIRLQAEVWPSGRPRVVLADDHAIITDGLRRLLEPECEVAGIASDGDTLLKMTRTLQPDLVVADITMPRLNGVDAVRELLRQLPKTRVIFLTMHADRAYVAEAFDAGAAGFVVKHAAPEELWQAINAVLAGGAYISPLVGGAGAIASKQRPQLLHTVTAYRLSTRQRQVLQLVAEGQSIKQIATRLKLAPKTIEFHKYQIMKSLGIKTSAQLIQLALKHGLIA
jgi:DNA-binding NarL/FixJ family response regulator